MLASGAIDIDLRERAAAPSRLALAWTLCGTGFPSRAYAVALDVHGDAVGRGDEAATADSADCLADCCVKLARYEQGVRFARVARTTWRGLGNNNRAVVASARLAMLLAWVGEPDAITEAEAAAELAATVGRAAARVWAWQAMCLALVLLKHPERAVSHGERAVQLETASGTGCLWAYLALSEALVWSALGCGQADNHAVRAPIVRAIALTQEALAQARVAGDGWFEGALVNNVAEYSLYIGDIGSAERALDEFGAAGGETGERSRAHNLLLRGRLATACGDHAGALAALTGGEALNGADDPELASLWQHDLCEAHERLGDFRSALDAFRTYHALHLRRASEDAERRARLCALHHESTVLRAAAEASRELAADLAASNALLALEAERLLRTSLEDSLTGLPNRRKLDVSMLEVAGERAPFAVAMIDIDQFKKINDRFSHVVGDAVLRQVGALLAAGTREGDLVARYGGEEFALLMRQTGLMAATEVCERLREAIEAHSWDELRAGLRVTVSIGIAVSDEAGLPGSTLALADERLYGAKRGGRNRIQAA